MPPQPHRTVRGARGVDTLLPMTTDAERDEFDVRDVLMVQETRADRRFRVVPDEAPKYNPGEDPEEVVTETLHVRREDGESWPDAVHRVVRTVTTARFGDIDVGWAYRITETSTDTWIAAFDEPDSGRMVRTALRFPEPSWRNGAELRRTVYYLVTGEPYGDGPI
jgi:hypothetical protein